MHRITRTLAVVLTFSMTMSLMAAQVEIKLKDGSRWRGQVNDNVTMQVQHQGVAVPMEGKIVKVEKDYIVVDGTYAGQAMKKTIFKSDIVTMKTVGAGATPAVDGTAGTNTAAAGNVVDSSATAAGQPIDKKAPGVFVLPMSGMVGEGMRHEEINRLVAHVDKNYGPGQIIILDIESGGGLGIEMEQMHLCLKEVRKRHRVVAWIREAISAAAATAINCDEIYFRTTGTLGAMTGFNGGTGIAFQGEELRQWLEAAGNWMEYGGRSRYIAWAMIDEVAMLSYDKDPVTGEVTWHNDKSGAVVLSDEKTNLVFTASTATDSGFADGVADTPEQLAKLLSLPKWNEKDDYGRKISKEWLDLVERAKEEIPLLFARYDYKNAAGGAKEKIGTQIGIIKELVRWWDRCPNVCLLSGVPPKEDLQRQLEELKRALARMN